MEVHNVELVMSAVAPSQYPTTGFPEIGLAGRSNVGKSSLINVLINRNSYARTSSQPGKTQTLNFYKVEDQLYFVDVPGYGYAKVSKKEREKWGQMIETYLTSRETLRGVVILVDARHAPTKDDVAMYEWMRYYEMPLLVVATKSDKIPRGKWNKQESLIKRRLTSKLKTILSPFQLRPKKARMLFGNGSKRTLWEATNLEFNEYQSLANRTLYGNEQVLTNLSLGLASETGQVVDLVKKYTFHGERLNKDQLTKQMGDVLWYLSQVAEWADIPFEEVAQQNIVKLNDKYPNGKPVK